MSGTSKLNKLKLKSRNDRSEREEYTTLTTNCFSIQVCNGFCKATGAGLKNYGLRKNKKKKKKLLEESAAYFPLIRQGPHRK
jgi:hypothetical protein